MIKGLITMIAGLAFIGNVYAVRIQFLHTNDTHAYLDKTTRKVDRGGSARLKALMDKYTDEANAQGITTLRVDAGDFSEGNIYYMADRARTVFNIHGNEMGYDIGILGNHDFLMGTGELDQILKDLDLKMTLITTNFKVASEFENIQKYVLPYKEYEVDGVKFAFYGLTTDEVFYKWRLYKGDITSPSKEAKKVEQELKDRGNDFIFALTHIGTIRDINLAKKTKYTDAIIGGHSHTAMYEVKYTKNKSDHMVPIVQAGKHMEFLGRFVVDIEKGRPLKVVSYELIPVTNEEKNLHISRLVEEADLSLNNLYGDQWLNEVVGTSDLKHDTPHGSRKWAGFITDTIREISGADVGIHVFSMSGDNYPIGKLTRKDLYNSIPRVFDMDEKFGWSVFTAEVKGYWLKILFEVLYKFGQPLNFSGIEMKTYKTVFGIKIQDASINGKPINPFKTYKVAFTEGLIRGAIGLSKATLSILQRPKRTDHLIWESLEKRFEDKSMSLANYDSEKNHTTFIPEENLEEDEGE